MPLDPYFAEKASSIAHLTFPDLADPEAMGRFMAYYSDEAPWTPPTDVAISDVAVPGPDGDIPVRLYRPAIEDTAPLMWLHGGGFSNGNLDMPEAHIVAAELAHRAGALVASVDYRLAGPDVHFPAPVDDAIAVWRWLVETTSGVPAVGGASAGAAIALSTALNARDHGLPIPRNILLAYPFLHFPNPALDFEVAEEMRDLPPLMRFSPGAVEIMVEVYVGTLTNLPSQAMPGAADLSDLRSAHVLVSELDDLRGSGELIVQQFERSGVPVRRYIAVGAPHGHLNRVPSIGEVSRSLDFLAEGLRGSADGGPLG